VGNAIEPLTSLAAIKPVTYMLFTPSLHVFTHSICAVLSRRNLMQEVRLPFIENVQVQKPPCSQLSLASSVVSTQKAPAGTRGGWPLQVVKL
jgi:hypothetical protein